MTDTKPVFPDLTEEVTEVAEVDTSPIVVDIPESAIDEEESLLPEDFNDDDLGIEAARTQPHPVESGWFRTIVVFLGCAIAFTVVMLWYNSAKKVKLTKTPEKTERVEVFSEAEVNENSDRIENAVQAGNLKRDMAAAKLAEAEKQHAKDAKNQKKPSPRRLPPPSSPSPPSRPAPPTRSYSPPRPPRISPPRRVVSAPKPPAPKPAPKPAPAKAPVVAKAKPVDRSPVYGGQMPETSAPTQPSQPGIDTQLVSNPAESEQVYASNPALDRQQNAFMQGQTMTTIPSGTTLQATVESEAIASDSATFAAFTTEEVAGLPEGSKVLAQVVRLAPGGYFEAELIALNGSQVTPGTTRVSRGNGKLLRAKGGKRKKGFFQSGLGRLITGFAKDAGEDWIRDQIGDNDTLNDGAREVFVFADQNRTRQPEPTEPEEASVLIPKGGIEITFNQDAYISR